MDLLLSGVELVAGEGLLSLNGIIALLILIFLEIVLGVDNIIFISIVSNKLPKHQQRKARNIGLTFAMLFRVLMLLGITWIIGFTQPIFTVFSNEISGRDLILAAGGLFLLMKSTAEIHHKMEGEEGTSISAKTASLGKVIFQIILLDMIFSFDSILTAIGMTDQLILMIIAVVVSMIIMMIFAGKISSFINDHPTLQILALSFLILIGFMLLLEAFDFHIPKGYIYFAVFFSLMVEIVNMRITRKSKPVELHKRMSESEPEKDE